MIVNVSVEFPGEKNLVAGAVMKKLGLGVGGRVQKAIDRAVLDYCMPYVPWKTGAMALGAYAETDIGSGLIVYPGEYARYVYYGEGIHNWTTDVHPLAGPFWVERMKANHTRDIVIEAVKAMKGKK